MKETVTEFIKYHHLIEPGSTVLVAVSGGPDSMALLHVLKDMRFEWALTIKALSVDHQLRQDASKADLLYVQNMCQSWDIECVETSVDVDSYKQAHGVGTQVAARELRYQFFAEQMIQTQADYIALGHHGDDQIETMLMSLTRSTSTQALSGIPVKRPFYGGQLIRPLLSATKDDIERYCEMAGIIPRRDLTNEETEYTRNDFRKHVLPFFKKHNPNLHVGIQYLSEALQSDDTHLITEAESMFEQVVTLTENKKKAGFKIESFKSYSIALQRRAYHLILKYLYTNVPNDLSYKHESIFFSVLNSQTSNKTVDFPKQLQLSKVYGDVMFHFQSVTTAPDFHIQLDIPAKAILPNGACFKTKRTNHAAAETRYCFVCPEEDLIFPLHIRTRRQGDRMTWEGLNGHKKLKDVFIDAKIPRALRDEWPIVVDGCGTPVWLTGLRKNCPSNRKGTTGPYIQIDYFDRKA